MKGGYQDGFWMVVVPGAVMYWHLKHPARRNPTPTQVYNLLDELGLLRGIDRTRPSVLATISKRLKSYREKGLLPD